MVDSIKLLMRREAREDAERLELIEENFEFNDARKNIGVLITKERKVLER